MFKSIFKVLNYPVKTVGGSLIISIPVIYVTGYLHHLYIKHIK